MTAARATRARTTSRHLDEARARLTAERVAAASRIAALQRDVDDIVESAKFGATDDEHDAEGATIAFERAQAMALLEETRLQVSTLDEALVTGRRRQLRHLRVVREADRRRAARGPAGGHPVHHLRLPPSLTGPP